MRVSSGPRILIAAAVVLIANLVQSPFAAGQTTTPAVDPLQILRTLTPEQQDEILRRVGGAAAGTSGDRTRQTDTGVPDNRPAEREPRPRAENEDTDSFGVPILKGDDYVIININFPPEPSTERTAPPAPTSPTAALPQDARAQPATPAPAEAVPRRVTTLSREQRAELQPLLDLIRSRNPYRLSKEGVLTLPGFVGIPLAGLTEFQATVRLQAERDLRDFDIALIRLPLKKIGLEALKPFGYDLFDHPSTSFAPVTNVPVPADYVVGPGDELDVQLYGTQNRNLRLVVDREGRVGFPELGPVNVGGQTFTSVKSSLEARVARQMIGVRANVSMGDTRSIRVFVLGDARRPGSYTISGLGTITSALFAAGGVAPIGSLRSIELRRQGALVRKLDLYDMLIRGDTTDDAKLLPGDVVFVPPIGAAISVDGEVRRPAIYELTANASVADAIELAGGLTAEADTSNGSLTRITEERKRVVVSVDLAKGAKAQLLRNGDWLRIVRVRPSLDSGVLVDGFVHSPATYAFREGLRLTDVIRSIDDLKPNADLHYVLIRRELPPNRVVAAVSADLGAALSQPGSAADVLLMPRDRITVFDLETSRERIIRPLLDDLRLQSTITRPSEVVNIEGRVKVPGSYPLEPGMTVADLIRAGGGLSDAAYGGQAELTRYRVVNNDSRQTELLQINLAAVTRGDSAANLALQAFDSLSIKEVPEWGDQEQVVLSGEVRFPGRYSIKRGETLKSVIARAGGLTEFAFPEGSVFTREELRTREQKQLDVLANRLQNDLATLALQGASANQAQAGTALTVGQSLLAQIRSADAVGRLVIDLPRTIRAAPGSAADVILRNGDRLIVPRFQQEVTVIGEVQTVTSHFYRPELARDDYIALSGGVTRRADREKIYVVRANGSVVANEGSRWFNRSSMEIKPGDTVVVPLDTERLPALPFWQAVTQIIYNLAISAAAVNSF